MCVGSVSEPIGLCALDAGAGLLPVVGRPSCCRLSRVRVHAATHLPVPPSGSRCSPTDAGGVLPSPGDRAPGLVGGTASRSQEPHAAGRGWAGRGRHLKEEPWLRPNSGAMQHRLRNGTGDASWTTARGSQFLPSASPVQLIP